MHSSQTFRHDLEALLSSLTSDLSISRPLTPAEVDDLKDLLTLHPHQITKVSLHDCQIGEAGAVALAVILKARVGILRLVASGNALGPLGAKAVFEGVAVGGEVEAALVGSNGTGDKGAVAAALAMDGGHLRVLGLNDNNIGDEGVIALSRALSANPPLHALWLNDNSAITKVGAEALAGALEVNSMLNELWLHHTSIGEGAATIARALGVNTGIKELWLQDTGADTTHLLSELKTALASNSTLLEVYVDDASADPNSLIRPELDENRALWQALGDAPLPAATVIGLIESLETTAGVSDSINLGGIELQRGKAVHALAALTLRLPAIEDVRKAGDLLYRTKNVSNAIMRHLRLAIESRVHHKVLTPQDLKDLHATASPVRERERERHLCRHK